MTGYSAAKAAVIALTKSLGKELADTDIRVNAVVPVVIATDEAYRNVLANIPLGRADRPRRSQPWSRGRRTKATAAWRRAPHQTSREGRT